LPTRAHNYQLFDVLTGDVVILFFSLLLLVFMLMFVLFVYSDIESKFAKHKEVAL